MYSTRRELTDDLLLLLPCTCHTYSPHPEGNLLSGNRNRKLELSTPSTSDQRLEHPPATAAAARIHQP